MVCLEVQSCFRYRPLSLAGAKVATVEQSALSIDLGYFD
jgi:hypothetical protein